MVTNTPFLLLEKGKHVFDYSSIYIFQKLRVADMKETLRKQHKLTIYDNILEYLRFLCQL